MKVELSDVREIVEMSNVLLMIYKGLKESEAGEGIKEIGRDFDSLIDIMHTNNVARNIRAFKAYTEAGMTADQAITLIGIQKMSSAESLRPMKECLKSSVGELSIRKS